MKHSDSVFHTSDRAETVLVVGDLVINREALRGRRGIGNVKRTGRQMAPGHGAVRAHCYQYVPAWAAGCKEPPRDPRRGAAFGAAAPCWQPTTGLPSGQCVEVPQHLRSGRPAPSFRGAWPVGP
jgi:hypothetical protein